MNLDRYKPESAPKPKIASIKIAPGMSPEVIDQITVDSNAVVLTVFATGTSPETLNDVIKKRTEEGIPVFLVSDNPGDPHGILKATYGPQEESKNSGAISIEKANVNNLDLITAVIEDEFQKGKRGAELGKAVQEKFAFQEDEPKPIPAWAKPEEIAEQERIYRQTLKRQNVGAAEIEDTIKKWKGEL